MTEPSPSSSPAPEAIGPQADEEAASVVVSPTEDEEEEEETTKISPDTTTEEVAAADDDNNAAAIDTPGEDAAQGAASSSASHGILKKKRFCRYPGCTKVIKSQGHCQRHGAKAKRCKVDGCDKQAQGTHDGMCKRHWKAIHFPESHTIKQDTQPPPPEGESVYDGVLPHSISYRPSILHGKAQQTTPPPPQQNGNNSDDPPPPPGGVSVMPLVSFFRDGGRKEPGWHRNAERRARGLFPVSTLSSQLEPWERQLALVEILLLSGGTPYANFQDLAHAWGREKGFHHVLASNVCERRGEVERKRRSDAGKPMTDEQREVFRTKLKRTRTDGSNTSDVTMEPVPGEEEDAAITEEPVTDNIMDTTGQAVQI